MVVGLRSMKGKKKNNKTLVEQNLILSLRGCVIDRSVIYKNYAK